MMIIMILISTSACDTSDTETLINNDPQLDFILEIKPVRGKPFRVTTRHTISKHEVSHFTKGIRVIVKYDPEDQTKASII